MSPIAIAAAQTCVAKGDIEANVRAHCEIVRKAASHGADLVVFPELSLTGFEPELAATLRVTVDDERLAPLRELARRLNLTIVAGAPLAGSAEKPNIGTLIYSGSAPLIYAKRFLHADEEACFSAGDRGCVINVKNVSVALAICADTNHSVHAEEAARNGAVVYAAGVFVAPDRYTTVTGRLQHYAAHHSMAVLMANFGSPTCGMIPAGSFGC